MPAAFAASILDSVLALAIAPAGEGSDNRFSLAGLSLGTGKDGAREIRIQRLEAAALRVASGPLVLEVGQFTVHELLAQVRIEAGMPRLAGAAAAGAELSGVKLHGPLIVPAQTAGDVQASHWSLGPLAAAEGTIQAEIVDAHLLFDADVTVRIRQGHVDFNDATVEHVGPDSRMGVSRLGLYVDAPNGRSYLYQFPSALVAGVEYERRGAMLGPRVTDRGRLGLQTFGEALLRQPPAGPALGFTEQSRQLFDRTAVSGHLQLGDGRFAMPGLQADLAGRAEGRNLMRLHSEAVGRGLTIELASLAARDVGATVRAVHVGCDEVAGALTLRLFLEGTQLRFALDVPQLKLSRLRLR